jgi:uncharacterized protein
VRNLLIFILALIVIWWVRRALRRLQDGRGAAPRSRASQDSDREQPELMRACAHCGLHVPETEGVCDGDVFFCCDQHRRLGVRR